MRLGEYLPWLLATFASLIFVSAVVPERWTTARKRVFQFFVAASFFLLIGAYWLSTGEKFDETAYRLLLCRLHDFERCVDSGGKNIAAPPQSAASQDAENLRKAIEDFRREQAEAEARRKKDQQDQETRQKAEDEARRRREAEAAAAAKASAAHAALAEREATGDAAIRTAFQYWRKSNFEIAARYFENALTILNQLPNSGDYRVRNKIAEAHSYIGFAYALAGATPTDKRNGCNRMRQARQIYVEIGNSAQVARVDQDYSTGGC